MKENIPLQLNEEIVPIRGYERIYSITNFGRVWSHKRIRKFGKISHNIGGKFLKFLITKDGYLVIGLNLNNKRKNCLIARLTAQAFIPNPQNLPEVNHKDGDKQNNFAGTKEKNYEDSNLEWNTHQDNMKHAIKYGLYQNKYSKYRGVFINKYCKIHPWIAQINFNKKYYYIGSYRTEIEAAQAYNDYILEHKLKNTLNDIDIVMYKKSKRETKILSKYRGVSKIKSKIHPWRAYVMFNRRMIHIGVYSTNIEAARAYNKYVIEHNLNKPLNDI